MHERPGVTRDRKELDCEWNGRRFTLIDTGGVDFQDEDPLAGSIRDRRAPVSPTRRWRCWSSTRAPGVRPGDEEMADLLRRSPLPTIVAANKCDGVGEIAARRRVPPARPRRADARLGRPGARHRRPARPDRRAAAGRRGRAGGRQRDPPGDHRPPERRQVLARQPLPRRGARDRLRRRRHHARRDRHAAARRRSQADARSTPRACAASRRSPTRSSTTRRCAPSAPPSAPTSRSSSATPPTASPPRTCAIAELAMKAGCATAIVLNKWDRARRRPRMDLDHERGRVADEAAAAPARADRERAHRAPRGAAA